MPPRPCRRLPRLRPSTSRLRIRERRVEVGERVDAPGREQDRGASSPTSMNRQRPLRIADLSLDLKTSPKRPVWRPRATPPARSERAAARLARARQRQREVEQGSGCGRAGADRQPDACPLERVARRGRALETATPRIVVRGPGHATVACLGDHLYTPCALDAFARPAAKTPIPATSAAPATLPSTAPGMTLRLGTASTSANPSLVPARTSNVRRAGPYPAARASIVPRPGFY